MKPDIKPEGVGEASPLKNAVDQDLPQAPDFRFIPITLTFDGYTPFRFKFKRQQSKDVKNARQAFYAMTDEEQGKQITSYRISILSQLLEERPTGVWNFPEIDDFKQGFVDYFNDPDNEEVLQWIWSQYQEKLYPKELLSSPLE